jgi:hypothetical protein
VLRDPVASAGSEAVSATSLPAAKSGSPDIDAGPTARSGSLPCGGFPATIQAASVLCCQFFNHALSPAFNSDFNFDIFFNCSSSHSISIDFNAVS